MRRRSLRFAIPLSLLLWAGIFTALHAQTATILTLGTPVKGELSAAVDVKLSGSLGSGIAALQFTPATPAAPVTMNVVAGPALAAAQKSLSCGANGRCIAYGLNQTLIVDGVVATITFTAPTSASLSHAIADLLGANLAGSAIILTTPGPVTVSLTSRCDLNGDGKTDIADIAGAVIQAVGGAVCGSADLTGRGKCDVLDVQRIVNAATGAGCKSGTP